MISRIRCAHCRRLFEPNPRVKNQRYCEDEPCQRAGKIRGKSKNWHQTLTIGRTSENATGNGAPGIPLFGVFIELPIRAQLSETVFFKDTETGKGAA